MPTRTDDLLRKLGLPARRKRTDSLTFEAVAPGHSCPQRCPSPDQVPAAASADLLGPPLSIKEAARLIGCSPWTVRQRYLAAGIPHHRATPNGKLIFYRNQIVRWLLTRQQKG